MKFLILNTDYLEFLSSLYAQHPNLDKKSYEEQMQVRNDSLFGVADFYSSNLRKLGHEAYDIHANNEYMQKAWAREHGLPVKRPATWWRGPLQRGRRVAARTPLRHVKPFFRPILRSLDGYQSWFYEILSAQIKHNKPDVLLNQDLGGIDSTFLKEMKGYVRLLVGQCASPLPTREDFRIYDLFISSLPNYVEYFRRLGVPSELNWFAVEPAILGKLQENTRHIDVSFVGSLSPAHMSRVELLEHLCSQVQIDVWGTSIETLSKDSLIRKRYVGVAWGIDMYQILRDSKITVNNHIGIAESYANNMRLYEATGAGTLLITDWKENLNEMFEVGKEVVAYRTPKECVELIRYFLKHEDERQAIARAGQERTLRDHTYYSRMQELVYIVQKYIGPNV
jgi:hypothetical protein